MDAHTGAVEAHLGALAAHLGAMMWKPAIMTRFRFHLLIFLCTVLALVLAPVPYKILRKL
jgi:hypothetical protein